MGRSDRRGGSLVATMALMALVTLTHVLASAARADGPAVAVRAWTREGHVHAAQVDGLGFLWTASDRGLCRFDGTTWTCPRARCDGRLFAAPDGTVWGCSDVKRQTVTSARGTQVGEWTLPSVGHPVSVIGVDADALMVGGAHGVWRWKPGASPRALTSRAAHLAVASGGRLWLGNDQGLFDASGPSDGPAVLAGPTEAMASSADGRLFVAVASQGIWELDAASPAPKPRLLVAGTNEFNARALIFDAVRNRLWTAGRYDLRAIDAGSGQTVGSWGTEQGLTHPVVHSLASDTTFGIWAGSAQGVVQLRVDDPIVTVGRAQGLPGDLAFSLSQAPDGAIWTSSTGGVARWDGRTVTSFANTVAPRHRDLRAVVAATDGTVWAAGDQAGLLWLRDGRFQEPTVRGLKHPLPVHALREGSRGTLWTGGADGTIGRIDHGSYSQVMPPLDGDAPGRVNDVVEDGSGGVWAIIAERRVVRIRAGQVRHFEVVPGSPRGSAVAIAVDDRGATWIGSRGNGLFRIVDDRIQNVTAAHGLWDDWVQGIVDDGAGKLWMSSTKGIFRVDLAQLDAFFAGRIGAIESIPYQLADGLASNEATSGYGSPAMRARDGTLWFVSVAGIVKLDPRALIGPPALRGANIVSVELDGRPVLQPGSSTASSHGQLRFDYVAPSLWQPSRVRYRHLLEGWQSDWSSPTGQTVARLDGVRSGHYTFRVQAFSIDSPHAVVEGRWELTLVAPLYRRPWFLSAVALVALAALANAVRLNRLRRARVHEAVQSDRRRIAQDIHDSLEQDLTGLKMQVEAAAMWLGSEPQRARDHLDRAAELVADGLVDTRNAVWGLRSAVVPSAELVSALGLRLARAVEAAGVQLSLTSTGPSCDLPSLTASQLVYVVREAVTNALKHARPRTITICVDLRQPGRIRITVDDDGPGVTATTSGRGFASGMGLDGMKERMRRIGGTFELRSPPSGGTSIEVTAPLAPR